MAEVAGVLLVLVAFVGLVVVIGVPLMLYRAWALTTLWGWFMVPLGLPALSLVQMLGVTLVVSLLWFHTEPPLTKEQEEKKWERVASVVLTPILAVGTGYVVKHWFM